MKSREKAKNECFFSIVLNHSFKNDVAVAQEVIKILNPEFLPVQ